MELIYFWIQNFKILQNTGFDLSGKFQVDFQPELKNCAIKVNDSLPDDFFKGVDNTICIVGKNGSGKTTLLQAIVNMFNSDKNLELGKSFILYKRSGRIFYKGDFDFKEYKFTVNGEQVHVEKDRESQCKIIYYSPVYNPEPFKSSVVAKKKYFRDVSNSSISLSSVTNQKMDLTFQYEAMNYEPLKSDSDRTHFYKLSLKRTSKREIYSKVEFLVHKWISLKERRRDDIILFQSAIFYPLSRLHDGSSDSLIREATQEIAYRISSMLEEHDPLDTYILKTWFNYDNKISISSNIYFFEYVFNFQKNPKLPKHIQSESFAKKIDLFRKRIDECEALVGKIESRLKGSDLRLSYPIKLDSRHINVAVGILEELNGARRLSSSVFHLSWDGISSGEFAKINMFSRILRAYKELEISKVDDEIILMIDEGDIFLHPEWQRNLLKDLFRFIKSLDRGSKTQLLLTTHSPIVISDVPKQNVIFMGQKKDESLLHREVITETFASNIHELYWKGFFTSVAVGAFAKEHLDEVVSLISSKKALSEKDQIYCRKIIDLIGEKPVQQSLQNIFYKNHLMKEEKIIFLEKQIESLKQAINQVKKEE